MEYKATFNLPQTTFPMKANLPQREPEMLVRWEEEGLYHRIQEAGQGRPLYLLHDGPPYANGRIHIGHALNKILKDIIIKSKTMEGFHAPYVPGWDCHGLPIEHQVSKELGSKKKSMTSVEFRKKCRSFAEKFYSIQREEFQRLGVFGDWAHPYLTMDKEYEAGIIREFGKFVEKGGVYKGLKPVLWCTVDQTALAEAEVEYENHTSPSIFVKFPVEGLKPSDVQSRFNVEIPSHVERVSVVIWTTTPWTLPANQALAMHPDIDYAFVQMGNEVLVMAEKLVEEMAKVCELSGLTILGSKKGSEGFEGLRCRRPLTAGESSILLGDFVTLEQGTGCVHIAPGHGMEDYILALRYNASGDASVLPQPLEVLVPVNDAGCFKDFVEDFAGQQVLKANPGIVTKLKNTGVLLGHASLNHSYPHCWRCKNPVIFRATQQWFVSMDKGDLRSRALNEIEQVQWIPERGRDRINGMITNRPDWCLSRQRIWGTPIPCFTCLDCGDTLSDPAIISHIANLVQEASADVWFEKTVEELLPSGTMCKNCGSGSLKKEQDILDVWFESGVSHAVVVKTRGANWWPASLYLEGSDQHRGWFHSALLASVTTDGQAPYRAVLTHGFVVDGQGKKMSKSAGNVVAPQDVIKQSGADILRLWVAAQDYQEDLRISQDILKQLMEAYRKVRNTCRFLLSNIYDYDPTVHAVPVVQLPELDRWALMRLNHLITEVRRGYEQFEFRQVVHEIDYFCSVDMSSTYLDMLKDRLYTFPTNSPLRRGSQRVLLDIVVALSKLMAPILSFTGEELWRALPANAHDGGSNSSVHLAPFPECIPIPGQEELEATWKYLLGVRTVVLGALEQQRRDKIIGSSLEAQVTLYVVPEHFPLLQAQESDLPTLFIVSQVQLKTVPSIEEQGYLAGDVTLGVGVQVSKAQGQKCERCWNYRQTLGSSPDHPTLCDRCLEAVG